MRIPGQLSHANLGERRCEADITFSHFCAGSATQCDSCLDVQPRYALPYLCTWPNSKECGTEALACDFSSSLVPQMPSMARVCFLFLHCHPHLLPLCLELPVTPTEYWAPPVSALVHAVPGTVFPSNSNSLGTDLVYWFI